MSRNGEYSIGGEPEVAVDLSWILNLPKLEGGNLMTTFPDIPLSSITDSFPYSTDISFGDGIDGGVVPLLNSSHLPSNSNSSFGSSSKDEIIPSCSYLSYIQNNSNSSSPYSSSGINSGGDDIVPSSSYSAHKPVGILTSPLPSVPTRNYNLASKNQALSSINVGDNGFKYWGIAIEKFSNTMFLTDRSNNDILIVDTTTGQVIRRFGQCCIPLKTKFYRPCGIVCDEVHRRLIICDKDNHRIVFCSLSGEYISSFGIKGHKFGEFNYPWDVDVSPFGDHIVVADSRNHRVQIFDRFGNYLKRFSVFEFEPFEYKKKFDYPRGITFDNTGKKVYVTDFNTSNVLGLNLESWESRLLVPPGKLSRPQGITIDEAGNLLVCDSRKRCVRVMSTNGDLLHSVDRVGVHPIDSPGDLAVMRSGKVAIVDLSGHIRIF